MKEICIKNTPIFVFVSREAVLCFETGLIDKMIGPLLGVFSARYINEQVINSHNGEVEASDPPRITLTTKD